MAKRGRLAEASKTRGHGDVRGQGVGRAPRQHLKRCDAPKTLLSSLTFSIFRLLSFLHYSIIIPFSFLFLLFYDMFYSPQLWSGSMIRAHCLCGPAVRRTGQRTERTANGIQEHQLQENIAYKIY